MGGRMRRSLAGLIALSLASSVGAQAGDDRGVIGWWRTSLHHSGETRDFYLHISDHDGQLVASFSNPAIGIDETLLGKVAAGPQTVQLSNLGWALRRDGRALTGVIPEALVPF